MLSKLRSKNSFPLSFPLLFLLLLTPPPISASSNFLGKGGRRKEERRRNTEGLEEKKEKRSNYVFLSILPPWAKEYFSLIFYLPRILYRSCTQDCFLNILFSPLKHLLFPRESGCMEKVPEKGVLFQSCGGGEIKKSPPPLRRPKSSYCVLSAAPLVRTRQASLVLPLW